MSDWGPLIGLYVVLAVVVGAWVARLRIGAPGTAVARWLTAAVLGAVWPFTLAFALENAWLGWLPDDAAPWVPAVMTATVPLGVLGGLVGAFGGSVWTMLLGAVVGLVVGWFAARWLVRTRRGPYARREHD